MPIDDDDDPEDIEGDPEIAAFLVSLPEGRLEVGKMPPHLADKLFGSEMRGVQCPRCRWTPRTKMKWGCKCGHMWNTFATRALCPACSLQWKDTQCPGCHEWSPHDDWHVPLGLPS